ncbi:hypothetical protein [Streptomyces sp. NPDC059378]
MTAEHADGRREPHGNENHVQDVGQDQDRNQGQDQDQRQDQG